MNKHESRIALKVGPWQTDKIRNILHRQLRDIQSHFDDATPIPSIRCAFCNLKARLDRIYKCRQCGLMLCPTCGLDHFGLKTGRDGRVYSKWAFWRRSR